MDRASKAVLVVGVAAVGYFGYQLYVKAKTTGAQAQPTPPPTQSPSQAGTGSGSAFDKGLTYAERATQLGKNINDLYHKFFG